MLELQRSLNVLRRWWWLLLGGAVIGGFLAYTATKVVDKPTYQVTTTVALAPAAGSSYFGLFSAAADAQLVATLSTAQAAVHSSGAESEKLAGSVAGSPSVDGELLTITLTWPDGALAPRLANAIAATYIKQEQQRLAARYRLVHQDFVAQENRLDGLMNMTTGQGPAQSWLAAQYADTAAGIYQEDADAGIQASTQEQALQIVQPATAETEHEIAPRATVNGALGALLGLVVTLIAAYLAPSSYERPSSAGPRIPTLTKV